jgi:hypothetical protein
VAIVRQRGGSSPAVAQAAAWLADEIRDHPALLGLEGEPLKAERLRLVDRIKGTP